MLGLKLIHVSKRCHCWSQVSYLVVDKLHKKPPEPFEDIHWDEVEFVLPYTVAGEHSHHPTPHLGSAMTTK